MSLDHSDGRAGEPADESEAERPVPSDAESSVELLQAPSCCTTAQSESEPTDQSPPSDRVGHPPSDQTDVLERSAATNWSHFVREWIVVVVVSLALALLIRAFVVQAFFIPSHSMHPTLRIDDRVIVDKISYRFNEVHRGDVVVFRKPDASYAISELIKRVVAVGGETVEFHDGGVRIDGEPLDEPYLPPGTMTMPKSDISGCVNPAVPQSCEVPEGMIFVLGDNRESSHDGRFFGPVDVESVVGRAFLRVWPPGDIGSL